MRDGLVAGALDRAGHVLRAHGEIDPDRVVAGEPLQPTGEERLEHQVPAVLLTDDDDEWCTVHARGRDRADRVAETGGGVQDSERRLPSSDREAGRQSDDRALVQAEHEAQIARQVCEERDLGRSRIREQRCQSASTEDVERGIANGPVQPQTSSATSTISRSFAH